MDHVVFMCDSMIAFMHVINVCKALNEDTQRKLYMFCAYTALPSPARCAIDAAVQIDASQPRIQLSCVFVLLCMEIYHLQQEACKQVSVCSKPRQPAKAKLDNTAKLAPYAEHKHMWLSNSVVLMIVWR